MGHRIIKVVQSLQALREQRAADVERASERGQNHTRPRPSPSRSPRPPWPGQRWRDARREPERPLVRAAVVPPREGTRLGAGGEEEGGERSAERGPSSSFQRARRRRDPLRCRRRGSWCRRNPKQKKEGRAQLERPVQGDGRARRACRRAGCPDPGDLWDCLS